MEHRSRTNVIVIPLILVAAICVSVVSWYVPRVKAIQDSEDFPSPYGVIEIAAGQSARLNVVYFQPQLRRDSPPPDPQAVRRVRLAFDVYMQDEENMPCGGIVPAPPTCFQRYSFLRRESREVELMPGQAASLNFTAAEGARLQAFIQTIGNPNEGSFPTETVRPQLVSSLEVREDSRTLFVVPALAKLFNPQPEPAGQQR